MQEIFIKAYHNIDKYEPTNSFQSWLYKLATHHCLDYVKKKKPIPTHDLDVVDTAYPEQTLLLREKEQQLNTLLDKIDITDKAVLLLRYVNELRYDEIAHVLHIPHNEVRNRLHRAKKKLRQIGTKEGGYFHEYAWKLIFGKQQLIFPLTMKINAITKMEPTMEEVPLTRGQSSAFTIDDTTFNVTIGDQSHTQLTIISAESATTQLAQLYLYYNDELHYVNIATDYINGQAIINIKTTDNTPLPEQFKLVISSVTKTYDIETQTIILPN